ncbi:MAG: hypothetical protein ACT4P6_21410 [Gemmatimonadaceae bacterium]
MPLARVGSLVGGHPASAAERTSITLRDRAFSCEKVCVRLLARSLARATPPPGMPTVLALFVRHDSEDGGVSTKAASHACYDAVRMVTCSGLSE